MIEPKDSIHYKQKYDDYWRTATYQPTKNMHKPSEIATLVAETCGLGSTIDIGCGEGHLIAELLGLGFDAFGIDVSDVALERASCRFPRRFFEGSALSLPFSNDSFDVVVSIDCMEHLAPTDVPIALREMYRITSKYVFLQIATTHDEHWHLTVEGRQWWEARCFEAGFRKHPLYYRANPYESLNQDSKQILILLEKIPEEVLLDYDLTVLVEERLLHTDMLREVGRRSDAHCIRYHKAAEYIRPGDRVLDVACGLGYGSHILYTSSLAKSVIGIDLSDFGVAYANAHYGHTDTVEFRVGDAQSLSEIPDHSIDFIAAFETIEHVPHPLRYLGELKRVLKPSGRLMICAPNNWADETGKDPNPHHLHVYTWERLVQECGSQFLLETGFLQTAGGAMRLHHSPRKWLEVPVDRPLEQDGEWILLMCMADPITGKDIPYRETAWRIPNCPDFHVSAFSRDYRNPWLLKGMVLMGMRSRSRPLLSLMQQKTLEQFDPDSVDYGAALCGKIYGFSQHAATVTEDLWQATKAQVLRYAAIPSPSPHQLRWQVSLLFAGGELARKTGHLDDASELYMSCAQLDVIPYSPLLGNKTLDALYWLACIAARKHQLTEARQFLLRSTNDAIRLLSGSWLNISGTEENPLPFGFAEAGQLMDKASRAAYMLQTLDSCEGKPGIFHQECTGFFERQLSAKDKRNSELTRNEENILKALNTSEANAKSLAQEVIRLDARAQELAREVVRQDAHAQELAREVVRLRSLHQFLSTNQWLSKAFNVAHRIKKKIQNIVVKKNP